MQVTKNGGFAALESPDGKSIYYTKFNAKGIWQVPVDGGQAVSYTHLDVYKRQVLSRER